MKSNRTKTFTTLFLIMLLCKNFLFAQTGLGNIIGTIRTLDGKPATMVTLNLPGQKIKTTSNDSGFYRLQNVKAGNYTLVVSFTGTKKQVLSIVVLPGITTQYNFSLIEAISQLNEVVITTKRTLNNLPVSFDKSGLAPLDNPQSSGVVTSKAIKDQQINRLGDAIRNVSGVSLTQTRGGVSETFSARGYSIGNGGAAGSIFMNGVLVNSAGFPEASSLEKVEVLKGSSALLYGNVSGGLVINMVTRKPKFEWGGELAMRYGSNNQYKPMFDLYGPISSNLAFRINGNYENDGSYRDNVKTERFFANPSLLFKAGKKTTMLLEGSFLKSNLTPDWGIGSLNNGSAIPTMVPRSQYINTSWAYSHMNQYTGTLTINYSMSTSWKLNFITSAQYTGIDSYGSSLPNTTSATGDWNRKLARANTKEGDYTAQGNLTGNFKMAGLANQALIGMDFTHVINISNAYNINETPIANYVYDKINIIDLKAFAQRVDIPNAIAIAKTTAPVYRFGPYLQDLISITKKFKILAGIRYSWQQTNQTNIDSLLAGKSSNGLAATRYDEAFSPKASIIYQPTPNNSLYISYSNNFLVNSGTDVKTGQGMKPSIVNQYEAGIKNEFFNGKLSANLSVYRIINSNLAVVSAYKADGVTSNSDNTVKTFGGQTTSDGFEIDITGNFDTNFYFISGFSYNNARYTQSTGLIGSNIVGEQLVNNPKNTFNESLFYTFKKSTLKNVKIGASLFYTGSRFAGYNNTFGQSQTYSRLLPLNSFTTIDFTVGYSYKRLSMLFMVSNVTNTFNYLVHDNYSITPIPPRQFLSTLTYKF